MTALTNMRRLLIGLTLVLLLAISATAGILVVYGPSWFMSLD